MPFFDEDQILTGVISDTPNQDGSIDIQQPEAKKSGFLESARAWYKIEDPVFKIASQFLQPEASNVLDPNFKPIDQLESTRPDLLEYADRFIEVKNNEDYNRTVFNIDYELEQKEILKNATTPVHIAAAMSAGIIDPINLIPFAKVAKTASLAARTAEGVAKGLALGAATGLTREAILQSTSETRSIEQTATNLIAESVAGSIFGGVLGALSKPAIAANKKLLASAIEGEDIKFVVDDFSQDMSGKIAYQRAISEAVQGIPKTDILSPRAVVSLPGEAAVRIALDENRLGYETLKDIIPTNKDYLNLQTNPMSASVGAAEVSRFPLDTGLAHINETAANLLAGNVYGLDQIAAPELRTALSKSPTVQAFGNMLFDAPHLKQYHSTGTSLGPKVQNLIDIDRRKQVSVLKTIENLYLDYTGKGKLSSSLESLRGKDKLPMRDISKKVWNNINDINRVDDIPQVNEMSKILHTNLDARINEMISKGIIEKELDKEASKLAGKEVFIEPNIQEIKSTLMRSFDQDKLADSEMRVNLLQKLQDRFIDFEPSGKKRKVPLSDDEAEFMADDFVMDVVKEGEKAITMSSLAEGFMSSGKFNVKSALNIPNAELQDVLLDDGFRLYNNFMEKTSRILALKDGMNRLGFDSFADIKESILKDKNDAVRILTDKGQISKTTRYYNKQIQMSEKIYRSALGQLYKPGSADRTISRILDYNYTTLLGGVLINSMSEIFMPAFRNGLGNTIRDGWYPMIRSLKTSGLSKTQIQDFTGALELKQNGLLRLLDGMEDPNLILREQSRTDIGFKVATEIMSKISGISDWTAQTSGIAGQVSAARLVRSFKAGITDPKEIERLTSLNIDKRLYSRISDQIEKHVQKLKGSYIINPHLWTDKEAFDSFFSAILTDVNSTVLKSNMGVQPLFVQESAMGKLLFQFSAFMNAATSRLLISGIQRHDMAVLSGAIGMITMGGLSQVLYDMAKGKEVDVTPEKFILAGISRSGLGGNLITKGLDIYRTASDPTTSRFLDSTVEGMIYGPSAGLASRIIKAAEGGYAALGIPEEEASNKDYKNLIRILPYSNWFPISIALERGLPNEE